MTQFVIIVLVLAAGWFLWRQMQRRPLGGPARSRRSRDATQLERDPATGVYRPVERKEPTGGGSP